MQPSSSVEEGLAKQRTEFLDYVLKHCTLSSAEMERVEKLLKGPKFEERIHQYLWGLGKKNEAGTRFPRNPLYCSFCGKSQHQVKTLIAGPTVFICDVCADLCNDIIDDSNHSAIIRRTLSFPREYLHAAASILSSISEYVKVRYPDGDTNVTISQDGEKVIVIIRSASGEAEIIERVLSEFGLLVSGRVSVNDLQISDLDRIKLQVSLDSARLQLKVANDTVTLLKEQNLRLLGLSERQSSVAESLSKSIQMSLAASTELGRFLHELSLRDENSDIQVLVNALQDRLEYGIIEADEAEVKKKLEAVHKRKPSALKEIYQVAKDTGASGGGSLLAMWIAQVLGLL